MICVSKTDSIRLNQQTNQYHCLSNPIVSFHLKRLILGRIASFDRDFRCQLSES